MLEIVDHFSDQVHIVVGSQQTEPADGWPYDTVMKLLKRRLTREQLAKGIVAAYINDYRRKRVTNVTQSAVDAARTGRAVTAVNRLGVLLTRYFDHFEPFLRNMRLEVQAFEMADYVDLIHFASTLGARIRHALISPAANEVVLSTRACVLANGKLGQSVKNANGLSIWFPAQKDLYYQYRPKYLRLNCNSSTSGWVRFLDRYHRD
jgi:Clostripain family